MNGLAAADVFRLQVYKCVRSNLVCGNSNIRHLSEWCSTNVNIHTGRVLADMMRLYHGLDIAQIRHLLSEQYDWTHGPLVHELCLLRDGVLQKEFLSHANILFLIMYITCD